RFGVQVDEQVPAHNEIEGRLAREEARIDEVSLPELHPLADPALQLPAVLPRAEITLAYRRGRLAERELVIDPASRPREGPRAEIDGKQRPRRTEQARLVQRQRERVGLLAGAARHTEQPAAPAALHVAAHVLHEQREMSAGAKEPRLGHEKILEQFL